jgi:hypothetical protein
MPGRRKLNPEKILELLMTTCPQCAAKIRQKRESTKAR